MNRAVFVLFGLLPYFVCWSFTFADQRIIGKWLTDDGITYEILDGFQVSRGPILITDTENEISTGFWQLNEDKSITLGSGWSSDTIEFNGANNFKWGWASFTKVGENVTSDRVTLKESPENFIDKLIGTLWLTSSYNKEADFSTTFTGESGLVELTDGEGNVEISAWSIASNVMKLSSIIVLEASISSNYFIGLDSDDNFFVYKNIGTASTKNKTSMAKNRKEFFDALLTGSWETGWGTEYKFRPIYGELKGKRFSLTDKRLTGVGSWEFSPSTGAVNIYGYEFIQGMVVNNDTIALLDENGDQTFYSRTNQSDEVRYSFADVKKISLNENSLSKVEKELSAQFQYGDYTYIFEFASDKRNGFVHHFFSEPFSITGETFSTQLMGEANDLFVIEDFIVIGDRKVFMRDSSPARLKVKSDKETLEDIETENARIKDLSKKQLFVVVTLSDGQIVEVPIGIEDLNGVKKIELKID